MRDHNKRLTTEEVKHPVVITLITRSQLVDTVAQIVSFGTTQFMPQLLQPDEANQALVSRL